MYGLGQLSDHSSTETIYHLYGSMDSFYPGYTGTFIAAVRASSVRQAKRRFERAIHDSHPATGLEAPLVKPIVRFRSVKPVGANKVCWAVFKKPLRKIT